MEAKTLVGVHATTPAFGSAAAGGEGSIARVVCLSGSVFQGVGEGCGECRWWIGSAGTTMFQAFKHAQSQPGLGWFFE
jgi:hypothetical protein